MPKTIKKRIAKPGQADQDEMLDFLGRLRETAATRQRQVVTAIAALAGIIIVVVVIYFSHAGTIKKAQQLETQGYQALEGVYEYSDLTAQEKAQKALEFFTQAYEVRKNPSTLLYIATSQYELGDYQATVDTVERLIKDFPADEELVPVAQMKKAAALLAAGEKDKALEAFDRISQKEGAPLADAAMYEAANLLDGMGRKDEAKSRFENLVKKYPDSPFSNQAMQKLGLGPNSQGLSGGENTSQGDKAPANELTPADLGIQ